MTEDPSGTNGNDDPQGKDTTTENSTDAETDADVTTASVSSDYKVRGKKSASSGAAVVGYNTATNGKAYGVEGVIDSSTKRAAGVRAAASNGGQALRAINQGFGEAIFARAENVTAINAETSGGQYAAIAADNRSNSGTAYGIYSETASSSDGAVGIYGQAETANTSVETYGIQGVSKADGNTNSSTYPVGVYGKQSGSGRTFGVRGDATSKTGVGMYGRAAPDSFELDWDDSVPSGVGGVTTYSSDDSGLNGAAGVTGTATAASGEAHGVAGGSNAPDGYGLHSYGDINADGTVDMGNVGLSAYLDGDQTIEGGKDTTVAFNKTNADDFNGHNTPSTGVYTVQRAGVYHVTFNIDWQDTFDTGNTINYELKINGSTSNQGIQADTSVGADSQNICECFSRTVFGLSSGDTIKVQVYHSSTSNKDIYGSGQETYITIYKVG